jgi:hypothetical protein
MRDSPFIPGEDASTGRARQRACRTGKIYQFTSKCKAEWQTRRAPKAVLHEISVATAFRKSRKQLFRRGEECFLESCGAAERCLWQQRGDDSPSTSSLAIVPHPMFSLSQCIIIGLASLIYVAGAAFLLTGHSFPWNRHLPVLDASEERAARSGAVEGSPYFFPVLEESTPGRVGSTGAFSPAGGEQVRASHGDPSLNRRAVERESENGEPVLLTNPIGLT